MLGNLNNENQMDSRIAEARNLVARALERSVDEIGEDSSIETLDAWDSLGHMKIILEIEQTLGKELKTAEILSVETVRDIDRLISMNHGPIHI